MPDPPRRAPPRERRCAVQSCFRKRLPTHPTRPDRPGPFPPATIPVPWFAEPGPTERPGGRDDDHDHARACVASSMANILTPGHPGIVPMLKRRRLLLSLAGAFFAARGDDALYS